MGLTKFQALVFCCTEYICLTCVQQKQMQLERSFRVFIEMHKSHSLALMKTVMDFRLSLEQGRFLDGQSDYSCFQKVAFLFVQCQYEEKFCDLPQDKRRSVIQIKHTFHSHVNNVIGTDYMILIKNIFH